MSPHQIIFSFQYGDTPFHTAARYLFFSSLVINMTILTILIVFIILSIIFSIIALIAIMMMAHSKESYSSVHKNENH